MLSRRKEELVKSAGRAAVVVLDGFGLDQSKEWECVCALWDSLDSAVREMVLAEAGDEDLGRASLAPTSHGVSHWLVSRRGGDWLELVTHLVGLRRRVLRALEAGNRREEVLLGRLAVAAAHHYAPWATDTPFLYSLRQDYSTWVTRTAGVYTGQVDMTPEVMGNSDTGHQQLFNLMVARQVPAFLEQMLAGGEFFENRALNEDLCRAREGALVVFKTLLSGEHGDDGYVHSAWPHMLAFFELYFHRVGLPAGRLQVEAVLDGRDSPYYSSLQYEEKGGERRYGYLRKLRRVLAGYGAEECLTWICGRQFMDRDYKGGMIRCEYEMVTRNEGRRVASPDEALALVARDHEEGLTDPMIEPIIIGEPETVGEGTVFFNAIFRADRQEPITAALLGDQEFITRQARQKKKLETWEDFTWLTPLSSLRMWCMVDYHERFTRRGVRACLHNTPHEHNILHRLCESVPEFRFLFLTEGVKEKHMGLFSRGRRSLPLEPAETQRIVATYGRERGVNSDNDLYKVPFMRHPEIARWLAEALRSDEFQVIAANFPGADMLGHLIENHFDACLETLQSLERALPEVVATARRKGWLLVVTSDHGNVEHYGPDHGNNDVLTSVVIPEGAGLVPSAPPGCSARLYDVAWTVLTGLGVTPEDIGAPAIPASAAADERRLVGRSLVEPG